MIDKLLIEAEANGLTVEETSVMPKKLKGILVDNEIYINKALTKAEKIAILTEEIEHYKINVGNIIDIRDTSIMKQELLARWSTYEKLLPYEKIISAIKSGVTNTFEFAEFLELPEDFIMEALSYYQQRYKEVKHEDHLIKFGNQLKVYKLGKLKGISWTDEFNNIIVATEEYLLFKSSLGTDIINRSEISRVKVIGLNLIVYGHLNEVLKIINIPCKELTKAHKISRLYKELYTFESYIAGVTKANDEGADIQKLLKKYFIDDVSEYGKLTLVSEPNNPHDKYAIKIIHEELGHIGYIPAKHAVKVNSFLEKRKVHGIISQVNIDMDGMYYLNIWIKYS